MKPSHSAIALLAVVLCGTTIVHSQPFSSGSNGSYGALNVTLDTTLDVPPDGIFHCTTINITAGRTLRFRRNALNTPVILLASGDVTIAGTIDVSGGRGSASAPGLAGPGGFDGGAPGSVGLPGGDGQGPGGGKAGTLVNDATSAGNASFATTSLQGPADKRGATYGSVLLFPIIGGSGGGGAAGNPGWGGGGGGGALLVASSTRITFTGSLRSYGGTAASSLILNYGSGGSIRLVAPIVTGNGSTDVRGNGGSDSSSMGRVRVDTLDRSSIGFVYYPNNTASVGGFMVVFPNPAPRLDIIEAAGRVIAVDAGPTQVLLPAGSPSSQTIKIRARDFGQAVPILVVLTPDNGPSQAYDGEINNTTTNPAETVVNVSFPANVLTHIHVWNR